MRCSDLISYHFSPFLGISSHLISSHLTSSYLVISSHLNASHLILSRHLISSQRLLFSVGERLAGLHIPSLLCRLVLFFPQVSFEREESEHIYSSQFGFVDEIETD